MSLTQIEADALLSMKKSFDDMQVLELPTNAIDQSHGLTSDDGREKFVLDIWRSGFRLRKYTLNHRSRAVYILARIDVDGPPHKNPDSEIIPCPHIHIYKEGYGDKWAYPLSEVGLKNPTDIVDCLNVFSKFCNIVELPPIQFKYVN